VWPNNQFIVLQHLGRKGWRLNKERDWGSEEWDNKDTIRSI